MLESLLFRDREMEETLDYFVAPARRIRRTALLRTGPARFVARYSFQGLALRHPRTGRAYRHGGTLEIEIGLGPQGAHLRHVLLRSPSLPPGWRNL